LFSRLHPNFSFSLAHTWSKKSRKLSYDSKFSSTEKEILFGYCKEKQKENPVDYYVFGHRHLPLELKINDKATYINLGEWINQKTYGVLEKGIIKLKNFK
jgi:UDP-2,3-diacylglucosamine hydrolase